MLLIEALVVCMEFWNLNKSHPGVLDSFCGTGTFELSFGASGLHERCCNIKTHTPIYTYMYMITCTCIYMCVRFHMCVHKYTYMYRHVSLNIYINTYIHTHIYIITYVRMYIHVCTPTIQCVWDQRQLHWAVTISGRFLLGAASISSLGEVGHGEDMCTYIHKDTYAHVHLYMYISISIHIYIYLRVYVYAYAYAYVNTYAETYTYTGTCTYT